MNKEGLLWDALKRHLDKAGVFYQRIESPTALGIPDLWIGVDAWSVWVEMKAIETFPVRSTTPVFVGKKGLRKEQIVWMHRATKKGVNAKILAAVGEGRSKFLYVIPGYCAGQFNLLTKHNLELYLVRGGMENVPETLLNRNIQPPYLRPLQIPATGLLAAAGGQG